MIIIPNKHLEKIETSSSKAFIREICQMIENIQKTNISTQDALELIKKSFKNKVYESSRTRTKLLEAFTNGFKYSEINLK